MTPEQRCAAAALKELLSVQGNKEGFELEDANMDDIADVDASFDTSDEGAPVHHVPDSQSFQCRSKWKRRSVTRHRHYLEQCLTSFIRKLFDYRTCRDHKIRQEQVFDHQMKASAEAYMDWSLKYGNNSADHIQRYHSIDELP